MMSPQNFNSVTTCKKDRKRNAGRIIRNGRKTHVYGGTSR